MIIAPSVLSANFMKLKEEIEDIKNGGAKWIHYDVMDGHFVPNISFGYSILKNISDGTDLFLDVHLMISDPKKYIPEFIKSGADLITFHYEACSNDEDVKKVIDMIHEANIKAGISIKPATPVDAIRPFLDDIDMILVMSVQPGFGGQKFNPVAIKKIAALSKLKEEKHFIIEVDGGINATTIQDVRKAGCDLFVAGSAVFNQQDRKKAVEALL